MLIFVAWIGGITNISNHRYKYTSDYVIVANNRIIISNCHVIILVMLFSIDKLYLV
jgi:hypothetical protein